MQQSESIAALAAALAAVQADLPALKREHTAEIATKSGGKYSYQYADLADLLDLCRKPLSKQGLAIIQSPAMCEEGVAISTLLMHTSGEWVRGELIMPCDMANAQAVGSAITYGRRYALQSMIGIAAEDDDDAQRATAHPPQKRPTAKRTQRTEAPPDESRGRCRIHDTPFVRRQGTRQDGTEYDFWACPTPIGKKDGKTIWCQEKPPKPDDDAPTEGTARPEETHEPRTKEDWLGRIQADALEHGMGNKEINTLLAQWSDVREHKPPFKQFKDERWTVELLADFSAFMNAGLEAPDAKDARA